ncbi:hypothetical protein BJ912DRAFT_980668, partial [Pholiota molesta]
PDKYEDESPFTAPSNGSPEPDRAQWLAISQTSRSFRTDYSLRPPSHFDFSQLRGFTIDIIGNNLLPVFFIIHHARNTLETLDIRQRFLHNVIEDPFGFDSSLDHAPEPLPDEVSLEPLFHLEHLSITLLILPYMPIHLNTLSSWCSLLRTAPRGIRTLEITLDAFPFNYVIDLLQWFPDLDDDDDAANTPLSTLDEIISNADSFPLLEYVRVLVRLPEDDCIRGIDEGTTVDLVDEHDISKVLLWFDKYCNERTPSPSGSSMTAEKLMEEDLARFDAMPCFTDGSWTSEDRSHPIPFERVEESVAQMLRLTAKRFCDTGSFVVEVEFGAHVGKVLHWGYPKRREFGPSGWEER